MTSSRRHFIHYITLVYVSQAFSCNAQEKIMTFWCYLIQIICLFTHPPSNAECGWELGLRPHPTTGFVVGWVEKAVLYISILLKKAYYIFIFWYYTELLFCKIIIYIPIAFGISMLFRLQGFAGFSKFSCFLVLHAGNNWQTQDPVMTGNPGMRFFYMTKTTLISWG